MKIFKYQFLFIATLLLTSLNSAFATEVKETKLKLNSGKMLFTLVKTEWDTTLKMSGIADKFDGSVDMQAKTFNFSVAIRRENFYLTGTYKYANDLMHEGYLESETYHTGNFEGTIASYNPSSGDTKVVGKMKIHGITKENLEISGQLKKVDKGYIFTSNFKLDPKNFNMDPPKIKEIDVSVKFVLVSN